MVSSSENTPIPKTRVTVKRVMISLVVLIVIYVVAMTIQYHHPSIDARDIASQIDRSVYFLNDVGVVDIKTGKVFQTVGSPYLWDDRHQRAAVEQFIPNIKSGGVDSFVRISTSRHPDMIIDENKYKLGSAPHMWGCDVSGRWMITSQYLIDVKNRKITKPQMPGYIARASNTNDCLWFHTDGALVLWNAVSKKVISEVAIPTHDQRSTVGDFKFDVSPDGKSAVFCIKTLDALFAPWGIEYGLVNLMTGRVRRFRLNDVWAATNPTQIVFLDNRHLLVVTMSTKYYVNLIDGETWRISNSSKFPRFMVRTYRSRYDEPIQ
ncbi:MAG: hypothetical protein ACYC1M_13930 [Armatimonadota bacterium]